MKILVTGCSGQIGSELTPALRERYGKNNVIGIDIREPSFDEGPFFIADVTDKEQVAKIIRDHNIDTIYHLVGILSARGEKNPNFAWDVNVGGLKNILDLSVELKIKRVFWPSSIAVFGPSASKKNTPQDSFLDPNTMYGVSKVAGELLCNYYFRRWNLDVRSLRYPGIISYKTPPGGGTTDYAVEIFYDALKKKKYSCFLKKGSVLPMMYMPDAVRATIMLMEAPPDSVKVRLSYNIAAVSFAPEELAAEIKRFIPDFEIDYNPDPVKQLIADSWPDTIDDSAARNDWGWNHSFDLRSMTEDMIKHLRKKLSPDEN